MHFPGKSAGTGWLAAIRPGMQVAPASAGVSGAPDRARRLTEGPQLPPCGAWGRVVGWRDPLAWDCSAVPPDRPLSRRYVSPMQGAQGLRRICRHPVRPVLKHGPRSLTCARVIGLYETHRRNESEGGPWSQRWDPRPRGEAHHRPVSPAASGRRSKSVHVGTRKMVNYA